MRGEDRVGSQQELTELGNQWNQGGFIPSIDNDNSVCEIVTFALMIISASV